jgi:hypothetical protein
MGIVVYADESGFKDLIRVYNTHNWESLNVVDSIPELVKKIWAKVHWIFLLDYTRRENPGIPHEKLQMTQFVGLEGVEKPHFIPRENWTNFSSDISFIQQFWTFILEIFEQE